MELHRRHAFEPLLVASVVVRLMALDCAFDLLARFLGDGHVVPFAAFVGIVIHAGVIAAGRQAFDLDGDGHGSTSFKKDLTSQCTL